MTTKEADNLKIGDKFYAANGNRWHLSHFISMEKDKKGIRRLRYSWIDSKNSFRTNVCNYKGAEIFKGE